MKLLCYLEVNASYQDSRMRKMLETVSPLKKEKLKKYRYDIDRKIGIYADVLLRLLILKSSGLSYKDIVIKAGKTGKPYLVCAPRLEFSVSHTRNAIAIALSDSPVGIDVERIRQTDLSLAQHIFGDNELLWLNSEEKGRYCRFFDIWTKKEAFFKLNGNGLPDDLKVLDVTGSLAPKILSTLYFGDYIVSVCSDDEFSETDAVRTTEAELIKQWLEHCALEFDFFDGE